MNEKQIKVASRASGAVAIAAALAITGGVLAGCGNESAKDAGANGGEVVEESATVEQAPDASSADSGTTVESVAVAAVVNEVTTAYVGQTDSGNTVYYATTDDGAQCILAVQDTEGNYTSWVGNATTNGDEVTVTDAVTGDTITAHIIPEEGDSLLVDLGDRGQAVVAQCPLEVVTGVVEVTESAD